MTEPTPQDPNPVPNGSVDGSSSPGSPPVVETATPPTAADAVPAAETSQPSAIPPTGSLAESAPASYTPAPTPQTDWARATWGRETAAGTPERWFEQGASAPPAPPAAGWAVPATVPGTAVSTTQAAVVGAAPARRDTRWNGPGAVVGAALLAAVLASGGTYVALDASGALDRVPAAAGTNGSSAPTGTATSLQQPISMIESSAIVDAAARTGPAVVRITTTGSSVDFSGGTIPSTGVGSGLIYDAAGWILTNKHVVTGSSGQVVNALKVELKDGRVFDGTVYGVDTLTDLAIVRIQGSNLPTAPIGTSANLKVGQLAIAIGSPLGTFSNSVTSGIVSATGRSITIENERLTNLIQTDAAINPGNSGGPLLDAGGNVIGVNTAIATDSNGIGFAIPIDIARPIMQQALASQQLSRPYLGIRYLAIDPQVQKDRSLPVDKGAYVGGNATTGGGNQPAVVAGGPAAAGGIREGDVLVTIGSREIDREHPLDLVLSGFSPGQTVQVKLLRDGRELTVSVTLGTRPAGL